MLLKAGVRTLTVLSIVWAAFFVFNGCGKKQTESSTETQIEETIIRLILYDSTGTEAIFEKAQIFKVNVPKLAKHWDRNLRATGTFDNFESMPGKVNKDSITTVAASTEVLTEFIPPLEQGIHLRIFHCRVHNSFTSTKEDMMYTVDYKTAKATMVLVFPKSRAVRNILKLQKRRGALTEDVDRHDLFVASDNLRVRWEIPDPVLGFSYYIQWEW